MITVRSALTSAVLLMLLSACSQASKPGSSAKTSVSSAFEAPTIKSKPPIIHLADNLDEKDKLGWCIDTLGRGFSEQLHAHSCKPVGDDVRFSYSATTGQIRSAAYENKCAAIVAPNNPAIPFGLIDCNSESIAQKFDYDPASLEFHPKNTPSVCITVSGVSRAAGPFMSRDLKLEKCSALAPRYRKWTTLADGEK